MEITGRGDLRLNLTNLKPNIENLPSKHSSYKNIFIFFYTFILSMNATIDLI